MRYTWNILSQSNTGDKLNGHSDDFVDDWDENTDMQPWEVGFIRGATV